MQNFQSLVLYELEHIRTVLNLRISVPLTSLLFDISQAFHEKKNTLIRVDGNLTYDNDLYLKLKVECHFAENFCLHRKY